MALEEGSLGFLHDTLADAINPDVTGRWIATFGFLEDVGMKLKLIPENQHMAINVKLNDITDTLQPERL